MYGKSILKSVNCGLKCLPNTYVSNNVILFEKFEDIFKFSNLFKEFSKNIITI